VTVPSGVKIVGETWSQLAASGSYFAGAKNAKVVLRVGDAGQVRDVEMQDLIFHYPGRNSWRDSGRVEHQGVESWSS
jgi:hypothetical protein